jgi:hypothetical protein
MLISNQPDQQAGNAFAQAVKGDLHFNMLPSTETR